ncbi:MAG: hypothetical protein K0S32_1209 [Bacteroidetes bacterium]|jgi:hypothetical protein|nr:hypothetical protein [Bacteroidota bacterium]
MYRKDLLVRQFEEFGKVLALILGFKKMKDWEKFEKEVADAARNFTLYEISDVEGMSKEDFERMVLNNEAMTPDKTKILATLLFEKMCYYEEQNYPLASTDLKNKCTLLYQKYKDDLMENEYDLDVHYKLEFLKNKA